MKCKCRGCFYLTQMCLWWHIKHIPFVHTFHETQIRYAHWGLSDICVLSSQNRSGFISISDRNCVATAELDCHCIENSRVHYNVHDILTDFIHVISILVRLRRKWVVISIIALILWAVVRNHELHVFVWTWICVFVVVVLIAWIWKHVWLFVNCKPARPDLNKSGMARFCVKVYLCVLCGFLLLEYENK